jgi:phosphoribosylformimino-5-aminoimidazole carboxamide ribotide isomerase
MLIYPAIDIYEGKAVRLQQGDYDRQTVYGDRPWEIARSFAEAGLSFIHVVDLEGAKLGSSRNYDVIRKIVTEAGVRVQAGGGVRSEADVQKLLNAGVERVIVGSIAVKEPETVGTWIRKFGGDRIVLALDFRGHTVAYGGWLEKSDSTAVELVGRLGGLGGRIFLCTDIDRDGMLGGPNIAIYKDLSETFRDYDIIASGGVGWIDDIRLLKSTGVAGVVVGKALYEDRIKLTELAQLHLDQRTG